MTNPAENGPQFTEEELDQWLEGELDVHSELYQRIMDDIVQHPDGFCATWINKQSKEAAATAEERLNWMWENVMKPRYQDVMDDSAEDE